MNTSKKINVNFSSLVGLKAELLRKQAEVKDAKLKAETLRTIPKFKVKTKKHTKDVLTVPKELIDVEDINTHKKSKLVLEAKARLYDRLKRTRSNNNENFLVDFANKSDESEEDPINEEDYDERTSDPEDDWVEYKDCFGRTRKCLRRDLPRMKERDSLVKHDIMKDSYKDIENDDFAARETVVVQEKEPEIEMMRRKWEEQTERLADKVDIHYQDVLFDEARAHGVGYYAFSQDDEVRAKQQANLIKLRKDTEQKQKEMLDLKNLRDKMEQNRLKAAKIRQRIRAGLPAEPTEEEIVYNVDQNNLTNVPDVVIDLQDTDNNAETTEDKQDNKNRKLEGESEDSLLTIENKIKAFGELLGKRTHWHEMSQEEWIYKRRKDRLTEFAPAYNDFKSAGYLSADSIKSSSKVQVTDDNDDSCKSDVECVASSTKRNSKEKERTTDDNNSNTREPDIGPAAPSIPSAKECITDDDVTCIKDTKESCSYTTNVDVPVNPNISLDSDNFEIIGPVPPPAVIPSLENCTPNLLPKFDIGGPLPMSLQNLPSNIVVQDSQEKYSNVVEQSIKPDVISPVMSNEYLCTESFTVPPSNVHGYSNSESLNTYSNVTHLDSTSSVAGNIIDTPDISTIETAQHNINVDKIVAGLKYLREKFEEKRNNR